MATPTRGFAGAGPAMPLPPGIALGQPVNMHPGPQPTYWVWRDRQGRWHLRASTAGAPQQFRGAVAGVSAPLAAVQASRVELNNKHRPMPSGFDFEFTGAGTPDGFDFASSDNGCVRFLLDAGGPADSKRIFIGPLTYPAPGSSFVLCP